MLKIKLAALILVIIGAAYGINLYHDNHPKKSEGGQSNLAKDVTSPSGDKPSLNHCGDNTLNQEVIVSVSLQHMWACEADKSVYDNAVITGMEMYPADLTPVGTYKIYGRQTDQQLAGHDSTGSWDDHVNYWLPFLENQYGTYGFHDLTQTDNGANGRADSDFGNVDINAPYTATKHGSHGCVEMPLAAAKWLYDWATVGATVVVKS